MKLRKWEYCILVFVSFMIISTTFGLEVNGQKSDYFVTSEKFHNIVQANSTEFLKEVNTRLENNPNDLETLVYASQIYAGLEDYDTAIQYVNQVLEKDPNHDVALSVKGFILLLVENYDESIEYFKQALVVNPNDVGTMTLIATALHESGNYDESIEYYDQALEILPEDEFITLRKSGALLEIGKYDQVIKNADWLLEKDPTNNYAMDLKDHANLLMNSGGGCLIATASYGTELAPQVQFLREIRDNTVMSTSSGTAFMTGFNQFYYSFSPIIADMERENPLFKDAVMAFITPMISTLSIMTLADEGNEMEVFGFGVSVIALNLGVYLATPFMIGFLVYRHITR